MPSSLLPSPALTEDDPEDEGADSGSEREVERDEPHLEKRSIKRVPQSAERRSKHGRARWHPVLRNFFEIFDSGGERIVCSSGSEDSRDDVWHAVEHRRAQHS
eukprot:scaffold157633_cov30-Tisochrysis_lutea.AAC.1